MGHFGFSYVGLIFLLMLTVPNLIWAERKPKGTQRNETEYCRFWNEVGQDCVTCTALVSSDFNIHVWSAWSLWLIAAFVLMVMYECWWIRYFKSEKQLKNFYSSFLGVPVAGATLPVVAFFFLGLYGKVIWLMVSVVILGIGHIGIHLKHLKEIQ